MAQEFLNESADIDYNSDIARSNLASVISLLVGISSGALMAVDASQFQGLLDDVAQLQAEVRVHDYEIDVLQGQ